MQYEDEIDLRNTEYNDTNEVHDFLLKGKAAIEAVVPTINDISNPEVEGNTTILGPVDLTTPGLVILSRCFSQDALACYNEWEQQQMNNYNPATIPPEPNTYGPMVLNTSTSVISVKYWDPTECCFVSWSNETQTCIQGVDELATVNCSACFTNESRLASFKTYIVYKSIGLNLIRSDSNILYSDQVIMNSQNGCYYSYSKNGRNSYKLVYTLVSKDKKDKTEKFNKYKDILNKMSNFAR